MFDFTKYFLNGVDIRRIDGRNLTSAPILRIVSTTESTWWMDALSMTTIELGLTPSIGTKTGMRHLMKSRNVSPLTLPSVMYTSLIPSTDKQNTASL